jgi:hypothetical protein
MEKVSVSILSDYAGLEAAPCAASFRGLRDYDSKLRMCLPVGEVEGVHCFVYATDPCTVSLWLKYKAPLSKSGSVTYCNYYSTLQ